MEAAKGLCVSQTLAGARRDARHHRGTEGRSGESEGLRVEALSLLSQGLHAQPFLTSSSHSLTPHSCAERSPDTHPGKKWVRGSGKTSRGKIPEVGGTQWPFLKALCPMNHQAW